MKHSISILVLLALMSVSSWAHALKVIEKNRIYIVFPSDENVIASRLAEAAVPMGAFLEKHGLRVTTPLHVILDDQRDQSDVKTSMIPHREIRIPMRAPGVLEDGFVEPDPWLYYLFKGLCQQGIYSERSGFMKGLHYVFGEIISPNIILPEWAVDGISHLLYEKYMKFIDHIVRDNAFEEYMCLVHRHPIVE